MRRQKTPVRRNGRRLGGIRGIGPGGSPLVAEGRCRGGAHRTLRVNAEAPKGTRKLRRGCVGSQSARRLLGLFGGECERAKVPIRGDSHLSRRRSERGRRSAGRATACHARTEVSPQVALRDARALARVRRVALARRRQNWLHSTGMENADSPEGLGRLRQPACPAKPSQTVILANARIYERSATIHLKGASGGTT